MRTTTLFNDNWKFVKVELFTPEEEVFASNQWKDIDIPHDWLIYDSNQLYENSEGWYVKNFPLEPDQDSRYALRFDGVYMDSTIYVNGQVAGEWKYGYSTFELDITQLLVPGNNEIKVRVLYEAPNSRWYSGAGIYRNVWFKTMPKTHIISDGIYIRTLKTDAGYDLKVSTEVENSQDAQIKYTVLDAEGQTVATFLAGAGADGICPIVNPREWNLDAPYLYTLRTEVLLEGSVVDVLDTRFGFRTILFHREKGFHLNGTQIKINGVCMHHDLGALGAAYNSAAMRRQIVKLQAMGVNAIRTSHNMPDPDLLTLADEMGILINDEAFDMWRRQKTDYDYARFFDEWAGIDMENFVRRDRNHPSVIMWSIGNEIYDTHVDVEDGLASTRLLAEAVRKADPDCNAFATIGSNFLEGENTQICADELKVVGYNYSERLYEAHHELHPDWAIYGSETGSTVQSRGVYHFPFSEPILADLDEQCSSLGNSTTSWGAKNTEFCIITERDTEYSAGQFIWTGFDYIGEPTPYQTKNSYFGQIDTAGFEKDAFYIYQAEWTDYRVRPMVHIFPYWDFNVGQQIDIRVTSNAPKVELFFNGESQGTFDIDHAHGKELVGHWILPYAPGEIEAVAYDDLGQIIARDRQHSFHDAAKIILRPENSELKANGRDLLFLEIAMEDEDGFEVKNANNRVQVQVTGAGRLLGLDNGDSTDYDSYKGVSRKLFMGKLLAMVGTTTEAGTITIKVTSPGLPEATLQIDTKATQVEAGISGIMTNEGEGATADVPIRKIEIISQRGTLLNEGNSDILLEAKLYPANCTYSDLEWIAVNDAGVETNVAQLIPDGNQARLIAKGDGCFQVRCYTRNGGTKVNVISQMGFVIEGMGAAFINPYEFVSAGLFHLSKGDLGNAEEHGVATQKNASSYIGFLNVDFGDFGTDEIELPIFTFNQEDFHIKVWSGIPGEESSELLMEGNYNKPVIWGVYQPEKYQLKHRIKGVHTICIETQDFINIKGFRFTRLNKGTAQIQAGEHNKIYGDAFEVCGQVVNGIGNNVSIEFNQMDFAEGVNTLTICGTSYVQENTIHIMFVAEDGSSSRQMVAFEYGANEETKTFALNPITGCNKVIFIFLPGSKFDFNWFRFS